jgi:hypothetical protein
MLPSLVRNLKKAVVIKGNKDQNEVRSSIKWKSGMKERKKDEDKKKEMKQEEEERRWMSG